MIKEPLREATVGRIAVEIPTAWRIYEDFHLDYLKHGSRILKDVCADENIETDAMVAGLEQEKAKNAANPWVEEKSLSVLCDHIVKRFHQPERRILSELDKLFLDVTDDLETKLPDLAELKKSFYPFSKGMIDHMDLEEKELFPLLMQADLHREGNEPRSIRFGVLSGRMQEMESDHRKAGPALTAIFENVESLSRESPYNSLLETLHNHTRKFVQDVKQHITFENFLLLPLVIQMEQTLSI